MLIVSTTFVCSRARPPGCHGVRRPAAGRNLWLVAFTLRRCGARATPIVLPAQERNPRSPAPRRTPWPPGGLARETNTKVVLYMSMRVLPVQPPRESMSALLPSHQATLRRDSVTRSRDARSAGKMAATSPRETASASATRAVLPAPGTMGRTGFMVPSKNFPTP